ncbi:DUF1824 family protein [Microseira sp. BLCC-F43]|jgi:hypothetical protein|uniref:DUF1824 family protein n=1 Tax=Microseira sp. BLCC-F43 TaxID=3153602 RepID=UPI0035B7CC5B
MDVAQAQKILGEFSCTETKTVDSAAEKEQLRQALLLFSNLSDSQNLGICANSVTEGFLTLETYLKALGYPIPDEQPDITSIVGPVYIKYNSMRGSLYLDSYIGPYRGVLVSCQSSENETINGLYGHLPLDLFV